MKKLIFLSGIILFALPLKSQDFDLDDSVKLIYKSTITSTPPHENFQIYNLTDDTLHLRWKLNHDYTSIPIEWQIALQDNEQYHNPVIDSNDIEVIDSAGTYDKMILNLFQNQTAGEGQVVFDIINLDSTQETKRIKFNIEIYEAVSVNDLMENINTLNIFPNPCQNNFTINCNQEKFAEIILFNSLGEKIKIQKLVDYSENITISLEGYPVGHYHFSLLREDGSMLMKSILKSN